MEGVPDSQPERLFQASVSFPVLDLQSLTSQPERLFQASVSLPVLDLQSLTSHSFVLLPLEGTKLLGAGRDRGQEKGTTEDEMAGRHH